MFQTFYKRNHYIYKIHQILFENFRWVARDQDKKMQDARKREMLVLVHKHLQDEGLIDAASVLGNQHIVRSAGEFHV